MRDEEPPRRPEYDPGTHPDVVGECEREWTNNRPWTHIRVLRKGVDDSRGQSCAVMGCPSVVEAVQYSSSCGAPLFYCDPHAVEQETRDIRMYDMPPPEVPDLTAEQRAFIERLRRKPKRRDPRDEEDLE